MTGADLLPPEPVRVRAGGQDIALSYAGGLPWALLEQRFGGPLLAATIPATFRALIEGSVGDILYIAWCGMQHLREQAPPIEEVQQLPLLDLLLGPQGVQDGPLMRAILAALPKAMAPVPATAPVSTTAATGTGSLPTIWRRLFLAARRMISGTA